MVAGSGSRCLAGRSVGVRRPCCHNRRVAVDLIGEPHAVRLGKPQPHAVQLRKPQPHPVHHFGEPEPHPVHHFGEPEPHAIQPIEVRETHAIHPVDICAPRAIADQICQATAPNLGLARPGQRARAANSLDRADAGREVAYASYGIDSCGVSAG